jgi:hypothetical protein
LGCKGSAVQIGSPRFFEADFIARIPIRVYPGVSVLA